MHKILKRLFSRLFFVAVSILVQVIWFIGLVYLLGTRFQPFYVIQQAACIVAVLWLVNKRINPAYKLAWTILILSIPVVGACVYLLFGKSRMAREMERSFANATWASRHLLKEEETGRRELEETDLQINKQSVYLRDYSGFPVYRNTRTEYFPVGEQLYQKMIEELKKDPEKTKAGVTGVEIAARIIKECKPYCQGVHIMALGWESKVPALLEAAGI